MPVEATIAPEARRIINSQRPVHGHGNAPHVHEDLGTASNEDLGLDSEVDGHDGLTAAFVPSTDGILFLFNLSRLNREVSPISGLNTVEKGLAALESALENTLSALGWNRLESAVPMPCIISPRSNGFSFGATLSTAAPPSAASSLSSSANSFALSFSSDVYLRMIRAFCVFCVDAFLQRKNLMWFHDGNVAILCHVFFHLRSWMYLL